ncbi:MAG: hypothetical protein HY763_10130 [Planctomycetes bacterium]|nr:hypothetical protein [Planctomycetota bacterium]
MSAAPGRFPQLRWLHGGVCGAAALAAVVLIILGFTADDGAGKWMVIAGGFGLFASLMMLTLMPLLAKLEATGARQLGELRDLQELVRKQLAGLAVISENTRISDAAKSLAHREQELDALRAAIRDDLRKHKWEAALNLIDEVERRFGYRQEAESMREEVDDARREAIQAKLSQAAEIIERHFAAHEWDRAQKELDRLVNALPTDAKVIRLQERMKMLKEQHKQELKSAWDEAVRRSDTDHAIDVLRELDQYLSPAEAQELQSSARNVFKEKLLQLGVSFRFAVTEKRWQDALMTGLELVRDFPNARMASEVREALDTLRERARVAASESVEPETARR